ncbi:MAG: type II toxin-antitoxin system RelB/DinJ family antitoxin [Oscillospiraceae bacterium]|nr:type II toxin-antitoxin system RelB/DinJ family antitoxin [Oscillospiraceae bacterium]MBQ4310992.1 type II toxin-antitoxin system RelB/DinJ family antitoxin [Oscillospiraceae bacterium]
MANLQVRVNDELKDRADALFASLGLDTSTAIRIFLAAAVENDGLPFDVRHKPLSGAMEKAVYDSRNRVNLNGPYDTAEQAVAAMLED